MHPLSNQYHRPVQPDTSPRVPLSSLSVGQSYVHVIGGVVRTLHHKHTGSITVVRHDESGPWYCRVDKLDSMVVVVSAKAPAKKSKVINRPVGQVDMF